MKTYLVGGAVRDELLGLPVRERDWVVVGATPADLTDQGYRPVGRDFPVFLHPQSNEEYALARTERKTSPGYKGFQTEFSPHVTLEQDLLRRDLTINAIAQDTATGELFDPYDGQRDLRARVLRHVSPAFVEDPLRVLRVARFAARFAGLGFTVAPETIELMREIASSGELSALVAERVWQETRRALEQATPQVYFEVLRDAHALKIIFPEVDALFGVPQPAQWHPEIDTGVHVMMVLQQAAALSTEIAVRFAALTHDLGKGTTPKNELPRHIGHEERSVSLVEKLCARLKIPNDCRELAVIVARYHGKAHRAADLRATTLVDLIDALDGLRRPARFEHFILACEADMRGRTGFETRAYPQADLLRSAREKMAAVPIDPVSFGELKGPQIAARIRSLRIAAVKPLAQPDVE